MNIAFLYVETVFAAEMFRRLQSRMSDHKLTFWTAGEAAPSQDFDVILGAGKIGREQMANQPKLALVQTISAGYEGIDIDAASELGIWVSYAPSGPTDNAVSVAEFAVFLMIGASRNLNTALASVRDHSMKPSRVNLALSGKTVCIVGLGTIGHLLADRLRAFGMRLVATDDHPGGAPSDINVYPHEKLLEAVADADYVVVCAPATPQNENLINETVLGTMKRGAVLVNIARGTLVDETAVAAAVKTGHLYAAGFDVLRVEPADPGNPLLELPEILVTPHIAGSTDAMLEGTARYVGEVIDGFAAGRKPRSLLNDPPQPRRTLRD
jgi:phosphoglycerate dehydrogenase-like enzyme